MADSRIYVAGHRGMAGSAIIRNLKARGVSKDRFIVRTRAELDLTNAAAVDEFFAAEKPDEVYLAAAHVGGIHANDTFPAEFIRDNLEIQTNVIDSAHKNGAKRLLFLGSSCIYPKLAPQPIKEESLLTGPLEPTNRPYALAKIAGVEMCWSYNRQYGSQFLAVMPTNLYGRGDSYHPTKSHVIPGLLRRFHEAKVANALTVTIWGTGKPRREFLNAGDMAEACVQVMALDDARFRPLLAADRNDGLPPILNIGAGEDITIAELAALVAETVGFAGRIVYDPTKPDGTPRKLLDSTRINELGWRPTTDLRSGLLEAYEDFKAQQFS